MESKMKDSGVGSMIMFDSKSEKQIGKNNICVTECKKSHQESHESRSTAEKS